MKGICCVGSSAVPVIRYLEEQGWQVLRVRRDGVLPSPISDHADLQVFRLPDGTVLVNGRQQLLCREMEEAGLSPVPVWDVGSAYPEDCRLNGFLLHGKVVGNGKCLSEALCARLETIGVKQGYARCSSVVLPDGCVLTDDPSIHKTLTGIGEDCRLFVQEEIRLPGYGKGFLGGACGLLEGEAVFAGSLRHLGCGIALREQLEQRGIRVTELGEEAPLDFGGVVLL